MLFNSLHFLVFFPIVVGLYFALPHRVRWLLLLISSYYFYMCWRPEYAVLIIFSTVIDWYAALLMGRTTDKKARRKYLLLSLTSNLGLLFAFKYFNFFSASLGMALNYFSVPNDLLHLNVLLPVGISFYTFQSLSYTIDVYRGVRQPEPSLGMFATFVSFFPQLVAGPIERSSHMLPQFHEPHVFDYRRATDGLALMTWGFFKKVVIADRVSILVDQVYNHPSEYQGPALMLATVFFAFQIYCDFSGYSDIAVGAAQIMGFDIMRNFNRPYLATSFVEFWRRWHISLSTWFRDYLYIPLGGNRVSTSRLYLNLLIVFLVSGLWHGANWTFVAWGALHGIYLVVGLITRKPREHLAAAVGLTRLPRLLWGLRVAVTFSLTCLAWIFFRANNISDAAYIVSHLFSGLGESIHLSRWVSTLSVLSITDLMLALGCIGALVAVQGLQQSGSVRGLLGRQPVWLRWSAYSALVWVIFLFGKFGEQQFIYFAF